MTENNITVGDQYELPESEINKAFVELVIEDDKNASLKISGDAFVGARIPALLTHVAAQLSETVPQEELLRVMEAYQAKPWKLVITRTPGVGVDEDGDVTDNWEVTRGADEEDEKILGPILTLLAYLVENEQVAAQIQSAGLDAMAQAEVAE